MHASPATRHTWQAVDPRWHPVAAARWLLDVWFGANHLFMGDGFTWSEAESSARARAHSCASAQAVIAATYLYGNQTHARIYDIRALTHTQTQNTHAPRVPPIRIAY